MGRINPVGARRARAPAAPAGGNGRRNFPHRRAAPGNARPRRDRLSQPEIVDGWASTWGDFVSRFCLSCCMICMG